VTARAGIAPAGGPGPRADAFSLPASFLQEQLLAAFDPRSSDFGIAIVWRLSGPLDRAALDCALAALATRHEALRTTLRTGPAGSEQLVSPHADLPIASVDLGGRRRRRFLRTLHRDAERPFDLVRGPLARASLYRLGPRDHVLQLVLHHAVVDGWSTRVLLRDFHRLHAAVSEGRPAQLRDGPLQSGDYAAWERGPHPAPSELFWRQRMASERVPLRLPGERPRAAERPFDTDPVALAAVPPSTMRALAALGRPREASLGAVLRTALAAALAPFAGDEIAIGVLDANRRRAELQATVGFLADFVPLHVDLTGDPGFAELLRRTTIAWREATAHRIPSGAIDALVSHGRAFDVTLNVTPHAAAPACRVETPDGPLWITELIGRHMRAVHPLRECSPLPRLAFVCAVDAGGWLRSWVAPNNEALPRQTVELVGRRFTESLRRASVNPFRSVAEAAPLP
jgi:hypothetical protein